MFEMPYDKLNDLVHEVADRIEAALPAIKPLDRVELNNLLSSYLGSKGVVFVDES